MEKAFLEAIVAIKTKTLDNAGLLKAYGLYKQATVGDNSASRPGMFDPKGRAKWDAWESRKGMTTEEAMKSYVEFVGSL